MKKLPSVEHVETLSLTVMRRMVSDLVQISHGHEAEFEKLRLINERLCLQNEQLTLKYECAQRQSDIMLLENQQLRDEIARLKNQPPRPPFKSSGMEPKSGLDGGTLARVSAARADLKRDSYPDDLPYVVAALSFGFWVTLLGLGGRLPYGGKANYEMTLWRAGLFRAFPHAKVSRKAAHRPLDYLRTFRNRIAHHESTFDRHLDRNYASLMAVTGWISKATQAWIADHSRVPVVLAQAQDDAAIMF